LSSRRAVTALGGSLPLDQSLPQPDTPVLFNRPLRPGTELTRLSVVSDDRWILTPAIFEDHVAATSLSFAQLPAQFRAPAKLYIWLLLNHDTPPVIRGQPRRRLSVRTIVGSFGHLAAFLHWLDVHRIDRIADVTHGRLDAYLGDLLQTELSTDILISRVIEIRRLWAWRGLLAADDRLPDTPPWRGDDAGSVIGRPQRMLENRTPRIPAVTMDRLLLWAMRFVEVFADDILAARLEHDMLCRRTQPARARRHGLPAGYGFDDLDRDLRDLLGRLRAANTPLPGKVHADGSRAIDWEHLGRLLNCPTHWLKRPAVEQMLVASGVPVGDGAYLTTPITGHLDNALWRDQPIPLWEVEPLVRHLSAACFTVIAYLSGMRTGEALTLRRGCVQHDQISGLWLLRGRKWKGATDETGAKRPQGEERADPWVVVEPVARAVAVLERLHDQPLLFPNNVFATRQGEAPAGDRRGRARTNAAIIADIGRLVGWMNAYCEEHGRLDEQIPDDPAKRGLAPSRFRRTLAWFIVRQPRGLVAGAIQYGHVQVQMTLGYSGTYASGFPDEYAFEDWLLRLEQFAEAEQRLGAGEHVSGPAAATYRQRTHDARERFAGRVLTSTRQAADLLANPTLQIYPGKGMTCVFDPAKAKCQLKGSGDDARRTPDLSDCRPGCHNIARTDRNIEEIRRQAEELREPAADPLSPEPRRRREAQTLLRLERILDEHQQSRPSLQGSDDEVEDQ
jgi:integrase